MYRKNRPENSWLIRKSIQHYFSIGIVLIIGTVLQGFLTPCIQMLLQQSYRGIKILQNETTKTYVLDPIASVISVSIVLALCFVIILCLWRPFKKKKSLPYGISRVTKAIGFCVVFAAVILWMYDAVTPIDPSRYGISVDNIRAIASSQYEESADVVCLIDAPYITSTFKVTSTDDGDNLANSLRYYIVSYGPTAISFLRAFVVLGAIWVCIAQDFISTYKDEVNAQKIENVEHQNRELKNSHINLKKDEDKIRARIGALENEVRELRKHQ